MSIYYRYSSYGFFSFFNNVVDCVYWYKYEALVKWFVDTLEKRFNVKFLRFSHWLMFINISVIKGDYISVYPARYDTTVLDQYLDIATFKTNTKFYTTTFPYYMIFTKYDVFTSDEKVEK